MSSLAQEESRSISENVIWGQRKRFADGKVKPAPPSHSWEYRRGQSTKRLIRLYKIVTSSYVPHAGYVDWSFEGEHPVPSGKYIKYPKNSN